MEHFRASCPPDAEGSARHYRVPMKPSPSETAPPVSSYMYVPERPSQAPVFPSSYAAAPHYALGVNRPNHCFSQVPSDRHLSSSKGAPDVADNGACSIHGYHVPYNTPNRAYDPSSLGTAPIQAYPLHHDAHNQLHLYHPIHGRAVLMPVYVCPYGLTSVGEPLHVAVPPPPPAPVAHSLHPPSAPYALHIPPPPSAADASGEVPPVPAPRHFAHASASSGGAARAPASSRLTPRDVAFAVNPDDAAITLTPSAASPPVAVPRTVNTPQAEDPMLYAVLTMHYGKGPSRTTARGRPLSTGSFAGTESKDGGLAPNGEVGSGGAKGSGSGRRYVYQTVGCTSVAPRGQDRGVGVEHQYRGQDRRGGGRECAVDMRSRVGEEGEERMSMRADVGESEAREVVRHVSFKSPSLKRYWAVDERARRRSPPRVPAEWGEETDVHASNRVDGSLRIGVDLRGADSVHPDEDGVVRTLEADREESPPRKKVRQPARSTASVTGHVFPKEKNRRLHWTPEMHSRFVDAVEAVGIDAAVPKTIMAHLGNDNLTRENVASHLQKYRDLQRRKKREEAAQEAQELQNGNGTRSDCDKTGKSVSKTGSHSSTATEGQDDRQPSSAAVLDQQADVDGCDFEREVE